MDGTKQESVTKREAPYVYQKKREKQNKNKVEEVTSWPDDDRVGPKNIFSDM